MKIILKNETDNGIAIMTLTEGADKNEAIKKFLAACPGYVEVGDVEDTYDFPNRQFRDAWKLQNNKIVVDKAAAKEIHLNRLRIVRNEKLEELDKEAIRKITDPEALADINRRKQILRDIPQNYTAFDVDNPYVPSELK